MSPIRASYPQWRCKTRAFRRGKERTCEEAQIRGGKHSRVIKSAKTYRGRKERTREEQQGRRGGKISGPTVKTATTVMSRKKDRRTVRKAMSGLGLATERRTVPEKQIRINRVIS